MLKITKTKLDDLKNFMATHPPDKNVSELLEIIESMSSEDLDYDAATSDMFHLEGSSAHYAAAFGFSEALTAMIEKNHSVLYYVNDVGETLLHSAAGTGRVEVMNILLKYDGNLIYKSNKSGEIPLHYAVKIEDVEGIKLLLKQDSSIVNILDNDHQRPVDLIKINETSSKTENQKLTILSLLNQAELVTKVCITDIPVDTNISSTNTIESDTDVTKVCITDIPFDTNTSSTNTMESDTSVLTKHCDLTLIGEIE